MTRKSDGHKKMLRFGDFIVAAYQVWNGRKAKEIVRRAVNTHLIEFHGGQRVAITEA